MERCLSHLFNEKKGGGGVQNSMHSSNPLLSKLKKKMHLLRLGLHVTTTLLKTNLTEKQWEMGSGSDSIFLHHLSLLFCIVASVSGRPSLSGDRTSPSLFMTAEDLSREGLLPICFKKKSWAEGTGMGLDIH